MESREVELVPDEVVRQAAEDHRSQAEFAALTARLHDWPARERLLGAMGEAPEAHLRRVLARRDELAQLRRHTGHAGGHAATTLPADPTGRLGAAYLDVLSDGAGWWLPRHVPVPGEGHNVTPGVEGTYGEIAARSRGRGSLAVTGEVGDRGVRDPFEEKWWVRNWRCTITFPAARLRGYLAYRFEVSSQVTFYDRGQLGGQLMTYVRLGTTADVRQPITNWRDVAWPVNVGLPRAGRFPSFGAVVPIRGEMDVHQGQTPAVGLVFGVIVGLASGALRFDPTLSSFETLMIERPPGSPGPRSHATRHGKVEYRYDPPWWVDAVDRIARERDTPLGG